MNQNQDFSPDARLASATSIVIKIGSSLLVESGLSGLRQQWLDTLADDVAELIKQGKQVLIVSSGAIALGRELLELFDVCLSLEQAQAAAAVGQIRLARAYQEALAKHGIVAAQVLVTLEDTHNRRRYLNSRATIGQLLELGCVPIVNENDTVATDEIRYGDNDRLAAQVAALASADVLILLSDVDGLYNSDPRNNSQAVHLQHVDEINSRIEQMAGGIGTDRAKGGMKTKLMAARIAMQAGCAMVITLGSDNHPLARLWQGGRCTWFAKKADPATARKQWIASMNICGRLHVDPGAATALLQGNSLLPAGVTAANGNFQRGDCVEIVGSAGEHLAQGLVCYDVDEVRQIQGRHSREIERILGNATHPVLVHRDDMAI